MNECSRLHGKYISDMCDGDTLCQVYLFKGEVKTASNGSEYLDFTISDRTGSMSGKGWDLHSKCIVQDLDEIREKGIAVVQGKVGSYKGTPQVTATLVRPVVSSCPPDLSELVPVAPEDSKSMYEQLFEMAQSLEPQELRAVVCGILDKNRDVILSLPGGKAMHHDCIGGWLYHVLYMARTADALAGVYGPSVNRHLLVAGTIIHDIGKLQEFRQDPVTGLVSEYTPAGQLLSHNILGVVSLQEICRELGTPDEIFLPLAHMIESHHGRPEYGSAVPPKFLEAELLHHIDMMDSRIWMYEKEGADVEPGSMSARRSFALGGYIYRPDL